MRHNPPPFRGKLIKYLYDVELMSFRAIAKEIGISRTRVWSIYRRETGYE